MMVPSSTWSQVIRTKRLCLSSQLFFCKAAVIKKWCWWISLFLDLQKKKLFRKNSTEVSHLRCDATCAWHSWNDLCLSSTAPNFLYLWRYLGLLMLLPICVISSMKANVALTRVHVVSLSWWERVFSINLKQMFAFSQDCSIEVPLFELVCWSTSSWCTKVQGDESKQLRSVQCYRGNTDVF